jgi:hypothetical protein
VVELISIQNHTHQFKSYGNILELMDFDENTHDSIILITGHGDRNTKIKLRLVLLKLVRNTPGMLNIEIDK